MTRRATPAVGLLGPDGAPWTLHVVDVRDLVNGVFLALTHPDAVGEAFNIAAAVPTSHVEGAAVVSQATGVDMLLVEMPIRWRLELSVDKAQRILGYQPRRDYRSLVDAGQSDSLTEDDSYIPALV